MFMSIVLIRLSWKGHEVGNLLAQLSLIRNIILGPKLSDPHLTSGIDSPIMMPKI